MCVNLDREKMKIRSYFNEGKTVAIFSSDKRTILFNKSFVPIEELNLQLEKDIVTWRALSKV